MVGGRLPIPEVHTDFPLAALGEELGLVGVIAILGPVLRRHRARPADRRLGGRRLPGDPRDRPRAGRRRPGVHHRRRQPQGAAADRRDAAVHQLRRLVAARQRGRRRAAAGPVGQGRRAAAAAERGRPAGAAGCRRGAPDAGDHRRRRRPARAATIVHVALVLSLAFGMLAGGRRLLGGRPGRRSWSRSPYDPAVIAAARTVPRGRDPRPRRRDAGAATRRTPTASCTGCTAARPSARSSAMRRAATAGRVWSSPTTPSCPGSAGDPLADALRKFGTDPYDPKDLHPVAVARPPAGGGRGARRRRGAVVMLDPRTGEVLALASTPTYDASAIAEPGDRRRDVRRRSSDDERQPLLPRATLGPLRAGLGVQDRDRHRRPRAPGRSRRRRRTRSSPPPRRTASSSRGSGSATAITRRPATARSTSSRRPRCRATSGTR